MNPKPNMTLLSAIMYNFWHVILPKLKKTCIVCNQEKLGHLLGIHFVYC